MRLVVFDTGRGGRLFAEQLRTALPSADILEIIDETNSPYGNRSAAAIQRLAEAALRPYIGRSAMIIIACNTVTAIAIDYLRQKYPQQIFIGFEAAVKPAAMLTKNKTIMILATNALKKSARYRNLIYRWGFGLKILEPDCHNWAHLIDEDKMTPEITQKTLESYTTQTPDVIVLACTHYVAIKSDIQTLCPNAQVIDPFAAIIKYIQAKLPKEK